MKLRKPFAKFGAILAGAMLAASAFAGDVSWDRLVNSDKEPQNWLNHHGNLRAHRFSGLDQINTKNVKKLKVAYTWAMGGTQGGGKEIIKFPFAGLEGTPVAEDGFLYLTTGWGVVTKLDTRGGAPRLVWQYNPAPDPDYATTVACCGINNRGAVLAGNMVISPVIDGRILALNKTDGSKIWEAQVADPGKSEVITGAPLIVKDMVVTGMAGAEFGVRGWIEALDIKTGKRRWRTYTIPAPGEPGHESWKDKNEAWKTGGGTTWVTGSYDPELNLIIWGTANPGPDWDNAYRPGDNLWTDSTIAIDADSGKIKWGFQHTPNDPYDYDSINENTFVDTQINGKFVRATLHANRNGYAYALDRKTGEPLWCTQFVSDLNWSGGLDAKCKPKAYDPKKSRPTCPEPPRPAEQRPRAGAPSTACCVRGTWVARTGRPRPIAHRPTATTSRPSTAATRHSPKSPSRASSSIASCSWAARLSRPSRMRIAAASGARSPRSTLGPARS
jgi:alcohol dehydrogenase (cytochrome c)